MADLTKQQFIEAVRDRLQERGLSQAMRHAIRAVGEFEQDEGVKFGDPNYGWDRDAAIGFADEWIIGD